MTNIPPGKPRRSRGDWPRRELASALHHAHTRTDEHGRPMGIIHRDVNPARIYLRPDGTVRLTDFALARSLLPGRVATSLPRPQGDAYYGAPEALLGEPMDARSDLFALGLVLLDAVTRPSCARRSWPPRHRHARGAALEVELRRGLATWGAPYGAAEAIAEVRRLSAQFTARELSVEDVSMAPGSSS